MHTSINSHSHRSTTKISHKPFKSRKSTKSALKELSKGKMLQNILCRGHIDLL